MTVPTTTANLVQSLSDGHKSNQFRNFITEVNSQINLGEAEPNPGAELIQLLQASILLSLQGEALAQSYSEFDKAITFDSGSRSVQLQTFTEDGFSKSIVVRYDEHGDYYEKTLTNTKSGKTVVRLFSISPDGTYINSSLTIITAGSDNNSVDYSKVIYFDQNGHVNRIEFSAKERDARIFATAHIQFSPAGQLLFNEIYTKDEGQFLFSSSSEFSYYSAGNKQTEIKITHGHNANWDKTTFSYDETGNLTTIIDQESSDRANWQNTNQTLYTTNENGNKVYTRQLWENNAWLNQIKRISEDEDGIEVTIYQRWVNKQWINSSRGLDRWHDSRSDQIQQIWMDGKWANKSRKLTSRQDNITVIVQQAWISGEWINKTRYSYSPTRRFRSKTEAWKNGNWINDDDLEIQAGVRPIVHNFDISNYPNPVNATTTISYSVSESTDLTVKIYDMLGREVAMLVDDYQPAGG